MSSLFSRFLDLERDYDVKLVEGESFKQAVYNGHLTDSDEVVIAKIKLAIEHYPTKIFTLGTYSSDSSSPREYCYLVVLPYFD